MDRRAPAAAPAKRPDRADDATGPPQEEERQPAPGVRAALRDGSDGDAGDRSQRRHAPDAFTVNAWTQVGRPGDPATRRPGDPATRRPGDPATRRPGDPATRRPGDPATRRPGDPATRRPGDPATRRPGDPATRRPGDHYSRGDISVCQPRFAHRRNGGGERSPSPVHISDHGPVPTVSRRRRPPRLQDAKYRTVVFRLLPPPPPQGKRLNRALSARARHGVESAGSAPG